MNADELDAAREAVSATKTWRNQMRADWGTSFREPEEVLDEAVGELLAERDRLRAGIMAADVHGELIVRMRESVWREFEAERDRLRAVVDGYVDDLSHIAFAVAGYRTGAVNHDDILGLVQEVVAERDRLRAVVDGDDLDQFIREQGPDFAALVKISAMEAERDRLRAALEALLRASERGVKSILEFTAADHDELNLSLVTVLAAQNEARTALDVSPSMGDHSVQQVGQRFRSNVCIHEEHDQCEQECSFCNDTCGCPCHATPAMGKVSTGDDAQVDVEPVERGAGDATPGAPSEPPPLREACADCEGRGCGTCDGMGWRINPHYFGPVRDCE